MVSRFASKPPRKQTAALKPPAHTALPVSASADRHQWTVEELRAKYEARPDLIETRHAEKSELLEIALAHVNQGIVLVDSDGMVLVFNKRAIEYSGIDGTRFGLEFPLPFAAKDIFAAQWKNGEFGEKGEL